MWENHKPKREWIDNQLSGKESDKQKGWGVELLGNGNQINEENDD